MVSMNKTPGADNATRRRSFPIWPSHAPGPLTQFLSAGAMGLFGAAVLGWILADGLGLLAALATYGAGILIASAGLRGSYPHHSIGLCNTVTIARWAMICGLIATLITPAAGPWAVFGVAAVALLLDGVDGWLARREGLVSEFGAAFDMEVDAVLALVLALLAAAGGGVGVAVILLGLPRYGFWVAQRLLPWLRGELPPRFSRKVVCVLQISVLIALLLPVVRAPLSDVLVAIAAMALIWSFWVDMRWLWRARA